VPHLRDGLIVAKVGDFRGSENPETPNVPVQNMSEPRIRVAHPLQLYRKGWVIEQSETAVLTHPRILPGAHLRDGLIVAKVGNFRGSENPETPNVPVLGYE
jgi:hypothetical protein